MKPCFGPQEAEAVAEVLASGWVAQGPRVSAFEAAFAERVGARHAVAVSSCTAGLHLALTASGIGPGDEVIVPSLSFIASANAVRHAGASVRFADVDPITQNLTVATVDAARTPATTAVMVVHQAGMPAELDALGRYCADAGLLLVEDAACALGSTYRGRSIGGHGNTAVFSLHPRKVITTGEGGMITTDDADLARRLERLRQHGMSIGAAERHAAAQPMIEQYLEVGFNFRLSDIAAAVGLVQLGRLDEIVSHRRALAARYGARLADVASVRAPQDPPGGTTNFQGYLVELMDGFPLSRDEVLRRMAERRISLRRGIMASHLEPAYAGHPGVALPVTERLTARCVILPLHHELSDADVDRVVGELAACSSERSGTLRATA
ncbi:MAG: DegT/DnrJ/EryC1/StrS family aminotransferase [Acidimicrobiales bacterium]|nr:DegT/DnrJ/EryC1/StrS family aminotransferase [Acidimicrobiales bacterium]